MTHKWEECEIMSTEAADKLAEAIKSVQKRVDSLQEAVRLAGLRDEVEDLDTQCEGLRGRVKDLRTRGYPFDKELESKVAGLGRQWRTLRRGIRSEIEAEARLLREGLPEVEQLASRLTGRALSGSATQTLVARVEREVDALESKIRAAERSIKGTYDQLESEVEVIASRIARLNWVLDQVDEASFQLLPTEAVIMAVKAQWERGRKDEPEGRLFLTDQRLIFEQKQQVATKKVLFITTEKKTIQELLLEVPVALVEEVISSKKGLLGHEDHLEVTFAHTAPRAFAHFHIDGQRSKDWKALIGRAKAGEFDRDRAVKLDKDVVERVRSAPTRCPVCNAPMTQKVLRGMDSITCEYCGNVIRL